MTSEGAAKRSTRTARSRGKRRAAVRARTAKRGGQSAAAFVASPAATEAFVWIHLPGRFAPVVCGRLFAGADGTLRFVYGRSYREREGAIPLSPSGMPLDGSVFTARRAGALPGPILDAAPGAWGRHAIEYRRGVANLGEIDLLLGGQGDRIGALAFSPSATEYVLPIAPTVSLADLEAAARGLQEDKRLPSHLLEALMHGTSIGGARPKANLLLDGTHWIAKFSSPTDINRVVRWEAATLTLAAAAGINVPRHRLETVNRRDVLLVERFDRHGSGRSTRRHLMLSALTLLDLDETEAPLASYPDLSEALLRHAQDARADRTELFRRMIFNILVGNEDDHAKNHASFWDGRFLRLTPAYDLVPQRRVGTEARQAMIVGERGLGGRESSIANALTAAPRFGLEREEAVAIADSILGVVRARWEACFAEQGVPRREIDMLRGTTMLSPRAMARD